MSALKTLNENKAIAYIKQVRSPNTDLSMGYVMSTLPVFEQLLLDNPNLFTTEGLSALLNDCISLGYPENCTLTYPSLRDRRVYLSLAGFESTSEQDIIHRIIADPKGWCMDAPQDVQEGAQYYQNMGQMLGPGFATNLFIYQTIRDNIRSIQKSIGISGVSQRYVSVRDRLFSYSTVEGLCCMKGKALLHSKRLYYTLLFFSNRQTFGSTDFL